MKLYAASDPNACDAELGKVWKIVFPYLETSDAGTRVDVANALSTLSQCISDNLIKNAIGTTDSSKSVVRQIIDQLSKALDSIAYATAIPQVLVVISELISRLAYRPDGRAGKTAAEQLILPLVSKLGDLRMKKGFEQKEALDEVLRVAMASLGPEVLLKIMPLHLMPEDR
jgi:ribosomal RNA-processing protein 12